MFRARLAGDPDANLDELSRLANELGLSESEREVLVIAYAFEREPASNEEEDEFDYLTEKVDVSPEEAERILADEDLFLIPPGTRYGYEPQEAMEVWAEAQDKLNHLSEAASDGDLFGNVGVSMLLWDAASRAAELRKRTEERVRETSAE